MNGKAFAGLLNEFAGVLAKNGAGWSATHPLESLAAIFEAVPAKTVKDTVKRLSAMPDSGTRMPKCMSRTRELLGQLKVVLKAASTTKSTLTDIDAAMAFLAGRGEESLDGLAEVAIPALKAKPGAQGLRQGLVDGYVQDLEGALGSDHAFEAVLERLNADKTARLQELKAIAKAMIGVAAKSKKDALGLIRQRHLSLTTSRAKSEATAGRSAA